MMCSSTVITLIWLLAMTAVLMEIMLTCFIGPLAIKTELFSCQGSVQLQWLQLWRLAAEVSDLLRIDYDWCGLCKMLIRNRPDLYLSILSSPQFQSSLSAAEGSSIDLDLGPPLDPPSANNYKNIQLVRTLSHSQPYQLKQTVNK